MRPSTISRILLSLRRYYASVCDAYLQRRDRLLRLALGMVCFIQGIGGADTYALNPTPVAPQAPASLAEKSTPYPTYVSILYDNVHSGLSPQETPTCSPIQQGQPIRFLEWSFKTQHPSYPHMTVGVFPAFEHVSPSVALMVNGQEIARFYDALGHNPIETPMTVRQHRAFCRTYHHAKTLATFLAALPPQAYRSPWQSDYPTHVLSSQALASKDVPQKPAQKVLRLTSYRVSVSPTASPKPMVLWQVSAYDVLSTHHGASVASETLETDVTRITQQHQLLAQWDSRLQKALDLPPLVKSVQPLPPPPHTTVQGLARKAVPHTAKGTTKPKPMGATKPTPIAQGLASYYNSQFAGRPMASGKPYNPKAMTIAHRHLPFGTTVKITNITNGKTCLAKVADRGPFHHSRIIDVSGAAAHTLGMIQQGIAKVMIEVVGKP
jgi:rare lipoprotein A (peptidoglycan hydrolase)